MKHPTTVAALTPRQKAELVTGEGFWMLKAVPGTDLPGIRVSDGPHGLRKKDSAKRSGSGIDLGRSVPATCFPTAATTACSWDVELLCEIGRALGQECLAQKVSVLLGPGVNIKRSPLCGRSFEYFSEDPLLTGKLAAALVRGVESKGVGTSVKHFACNSQEAFRMVIDEVVDERALREIYLTAFEICVREGKPQTVMNAYNRVNGTYASENDRLQRDILRGEWGFEGLILTDWGASADRIKGLKSGTDLEMPSSGKHNVEKILSALASGELEESVLDESVDRIIDLISRAAPALKKEHSFSPEAHHDLARRAAAQSAVLLKNSGALPVRPGQKLAVIGEMARTPRYQGAGSSLVNPTRLDNALAALEALGFETVFDPGTDPVVAAETAKNADIALVFVGLTPEYEAEGYDRGDMKLPESHDRLVTEVCKKAKATAVILSGGAPVELPWADKADAILLAGLGGQGGGSALADLLTGRVNPSGKLAQTWPISLAHTPTFSDYPGGPAVSLHRESVFVGYRYYSTAKVPVAYPFGFGLSYTSFEYSDLALSAESITEHDGLKVSFTLKNTGDRPGAETVQLYVSDPESTVFRPERELAAFEKVFLLPGEEKRITLELERRAFAFFNTLTNTWTVERGEFEILVGASSADIRLRDRVYVSALAVPMPDHRKTAPEYYSGIPGNFEAILGRPIPPNCRDRSLPLDEYCCLNDAAHTKWGSRISRLAKWLMARLASGESDRAMLTAMATQLPIRNFVAMSAGVFSPRMARGLLKVLNDNQSTPAGFLMILSGVIPALFRLPGLFKEI
ncbi:MAG: glycoside hydrolase family 3 C-terminal domain-containing protein [Clostridia bacterium]|nr:glycoside hydrolase family 3 C-terminal domain-containing protein [Clostridia bacterium]